MTIWVATKNGSVRHPVNNWYVPEDQGSPKQLLCRDRTVLTFVHICSEEEMERLRPCYRCARVLREQAQEEAMHKQLMKET